MPDLKWPTPCAVILILSFWMTGETFGQSVSLGTVEGDTFCVGQSVTLLPNINGFTLFTYELTFDGLAPNAMGTGSDWGDVGMPQLILSAPGTYTFTLSAQDGSVSDTDDVTILVLPYIEGTLSLTSLGEAYAEVTQEDGSTLFRYCGGVEDALFDFALNFDGLVNYATGTTVEIDWGDGSPILQNPSQLSGVVSHTYSPGSYDIHLVVSNPTGGSQSDCVTESIYNVFVGSAPDVTVSTAGNELCLPDATHEIALIGNGSEVNYELYYTDDSPGMFFVSSGDTSLVHAFDQSSCGEIVEGEFFTLENAFSATLVASNACSAGGIPTVITIGPIVVSQPPELDIVSDAGFAICPSAEVVLSNASTSPELVEEGGCTDEYKIYWELDEGLTLVSGNLGDPQGATGSDFDPTLWLTGDSSIVVTSDQNGFYQATMWAATRCGEDSTSVVIQVLESGSIEVDFPAQTICSGTASDPVTFSADPGVYSVVWRLFDEDGMSILPGAVDSVDQVVGIGVGSVTVPSWDLYNYGEEPYTIYVQASVPCPTSDPLTHAITVQPEPVIEVLSEDPVICSGEMLDIGFEVNTGDLLGWTVTPSPSVSGGQDGVGVSIQDVLVNEDATTASVDYVVSVLNAQCPGQPVTVTAEVLAGVPEIELDDVEVCAEQTVTPVELPMFSGINWVWENNNVDVGLDESGQDEFPVWVAQNATTNEVSSTVTVLGQVASCDLEVAGNFSVTVFPIPQAEVSVSPDGNLSCIDGLATLTPEFATPGTSVQSWNGEGVVSQDGNVLVVEADGTFLLELASDAGCTSMQEVAVGPVDDIAITGTSYLNPACAGEASGIIEVLADESEGVEYEWTNSASTENVASGLPQGSYEVMVTNVAGCQDSATFTLTDPAPLVVALQDSLVSECGEANGLLEALASGGTGALQYAWEEGSDAGLLDGIDEGDYDLVVSDANGCSLDTVFTLPCLELVPPIPNEFLSLNGDGLNERWIIENILYYTDATVKVFNRWGVEVFQAEPPYLNDWDGTNKRGEALPSATYFFVIDTKKKSQKPFQGFIEITNEQP